MANLAIANNPRGNDDPTPAQTAHRLDPEYNDIFMVRPTDYKTRFEVVHAENGHRLGLWFIRGARPVSASAAQRIATWCQDHAPEPDPARAAAALESAGFFDRIKEYVQRESPRTVADIFPI